MIYLIRHGLDDERFIGGWSTKDLTPYGIEQTKRASKYIKDNLEIKKIYSSDISRAVTSSMIINKDLNVEVERLSILREQNKGLLNGMDGELAKELYSDYLNDKRVDTKYPNGESLLDLYQRIKNSLNMILSFDNSLIVTHRGVINMIYYILNDIPLDLNKSQFGVTHASIHELDSVKRKIKRIYYDTDNRKEDNSIS